MSSKADAGERLTLLGVLHSDLTRCIDETLKNVHDPDTYAFWVRNSVRAFFGWTEAVVTLVRNDVIPMISRRHDAKGWDDKTKKAFRLTFRASEPIQVKLDSNGTGKEDEARLSLEPRIKACILLLNWLNDKPKSDADKLFGGADWKDGLKKAVDIRDNLMHPKNATMFAVERDTPTCLKRASMIIDDILRSGVELLKRYVGQTGTTQSP